MYSRTSIKHQLIKEFDPLGGHRAFSADAARLLVHLENIKRKENHEEPVSCYVLESGSSKQFSDSLNQIVDMSKNFSSVIRFQILVKQGGHYSAIDIRLAPGENKFIILDSAGDPRYMAHYMKMIGLKYEDKKTPFFSKGYIVVGMKQDLSDTIQQDCYSCPMFAFDFVRQISRMEDIYDYISNRANKDGYVTWSDMPPQLVWNAQSLKWIQDYAAQHPNEIDTACSGSGVSFNQYINAANNDRNEKQNIAVNILFTDLGTEAKKFISVESDAILVAIIKKIQIIVLPKPESALGMNQ